MLSDLIHFFLMVMHTIAPFAIIFLIGTLVWLVIMSRKWKTQDPERWNSK